MNNLKKYFFAFTGFILLIYLFFSWKLSNRILFPESSLEKTESRIVTQWGSSLDAMLAPLPLPSAFSLETEDGILLKGNYFQKSDSSNCAIILAHGWTSTWAGMLKYVPVLKDCRCDLVMYDHRAHGESGGKYATGGIMEAADLLKVTEWVQKEKKYSNRQIGWLGASWGGATVLTAGADPRNVAFIIADAPFQDWYSAIFERAIRDYGGAIKFMSYSVMQIVNWRAGIDFTHASARAAASKIEEPVLLIHSKMDAETSSHQSVNIAKCLNSKSIFHHIDWGGGHTEDVRIHQERFRNLINEFLSKIDGDFLISK